MYQSGEVFARHRAAMAQAMLEAAARYSKAQCDSTLDPSQLHQMSTSLEEIAGEVLMLGADVWPQAANDDQPSQTALPRRSILRSMASLPVFASLIVAAVTIFLANAALDLNDNGYADLDDLEALSDRAGAVTACIDRGLGHGAYMPSHHAALAALGWRGGRRFDLLGWLLPARSV